MRKGKTVPEATRRKISESVRNVVSLQKKKCQACNVVSSDVKKRPNRYAREVAQDMNATHVVCDDCDYENMRNN